MRVESYAGAKRPAGRAATIVAVMALASGFISPAVPLHAGEIDLETNIMCGTYFEVRGEAGTTQIAYDNGLALSVDKQEFQALWEESYQNLQYDLDRWFELEGPCRALFSPKAQAAEAGIVEEERFSIPPHLAHVTYERAIACGTQFEIISLEGRHLFVLAYNVAAVLAGDGIDLEADKRAATEHWLFKTPQEVFNQSVEECRTEFTGAP